MSYTKQGFENNQVLTAQHLINIEEGIISKQDALVSGVNIKTINGIPLLGIGDITIEGAITENTITVYSDKPEEWVRQNMNTDGSVILPTATNYNKSNIMHNTLFTEDLWLIPKQDIMWTTVTYDVDGNFIARGSWSTTAGIEPIKISHEYDFNLIFASVGNDTTFTVEEMLAHFTLQNAEPIAEGEEMDEAVKALNAKLNYFNFIQSCDIVDKMVHFSIDDCCACMYDLIVNEAVYTSPFENKFFGGLKEIHDATGACFTVNTFNVAASVPNYDIDNVPSKFQTYFQENKSWLRFAFHSEADTTKYASASITNEEALASYNRFVAAIYNLTGDYECIDKITRLGFFNCSYEKAMLFKNADHGVIGYLTADDDRVSNYYLNNKQRLTVRKKGKYYDLDNELIFINTLARTYSKGLAEVQNNPMYRKFTEFFWHESENSGEPPAWVTQAAEYCNKEGYIHGFPMDIFNPVE